MNSIKLIFYTSKALTMSKFIFTGGLLLLLASFLNYPTTPKNNTTTEIQKDFVIFPISEQIKIARIEKHFTQKELAEQTHLTKMTIERIEKGQLVPTQEMLNNLEKELGVELNLSGY
jgi:ribosome-binding protein aMBF1 (putative translation factor)